MNNLDSLFRLDGRTALVTGASSGLGRHFALTLARAGARVAIAARRLDRLEETRFELEALGQAAVSVRMDVADAASVQAGFAELGTTFGTPDIIVNNAGVAIFRPALEQSEEDWDSVIDTNLKGAWMVSTEAARRLKAAGQPGTIINIASITGARPAGGVAPYCASKAGLIHLTKAMALEWAAAGIRVNALSPGYISTELNNDFLHSEAGERLKKRIPQRRFGTVEHLDGPLLLLASNAGSYMSGTILTVDGGHLVSSL
ncbi:MAG: glucose 1-dehydrogenase [Massilia sp.]|nr:glucose 1-dehydrogenase [Massilia sp.]